MKPQTQAKPEHKVLILPDGSDFKSPKYAQVNLLPYTCGGQTSTELKKLKLRKKEEFLEQVSFYLGSAKKPYKYAFLMNGTRIEDMDEIPPEAEVIILSHYPVFQGIDMSVKGLETAKEFADRWANEHAEDVDSPNRTRNVTPVKKRGPTLHIKKGSAL